MIMKDFPFAVTDWEKIPVTQQPGEKGFFSSRAQTFGDIRVRMMEYSPGYEADHWCSKGHVILCLEGELHTRLSDGRQFTLKPGNSYQTADGDPPHRSSTTTGAKLFIVD